MQGQAMSQGMHVPLEAIKHKDIDCFFFRESGSNQPYRYLDFIYYYF